MEILNKQRFDIQFFLHTLIKKQIEIVYFWYVTQFDAAKGSIWELYRS